MSKSEDQLPDDAVLMAYIEACEKPPKLRDIARHFQLSPAHRPALRARLHELATRQATEFSKDRDQADLPEIVLIDIIEIDTDGAGIAVIAGQTAEDQPRIEILPDNKNRRALKRGSRCLARVTPGKNGLRGTIMRVLPKQKSRIFGRIFCNSQQQKWMIEPADKGGRRPLPLLASEHSLEEDVIVEAEIIKDRRGQPVARILRILGAADSTDSLIALAIAEFDLPHHFSDAMLAQASQASLPEAKNRTDIRHIPLVTIDGEDAKDFDDAVFAEPDENGGWRLIVAIADVAYYVAENSDLDKEARLRGNSVYLPGKVIPMLPEALSNGLCSLRPNEDRACLAVEIIIDGQGKKIRHKFLRGLMCSVARLTYTQVQQVMDGLIDEEDLALPAGTLYHLNAVFTILKKARDKRGALNLDLAEKRIVMDADNQPAEISLRRQIPANQLIEEMMILANICAAETLESGRHLCVFRVHDQPDPEKMDHLRELAEALNIPFAKGQVITPKRFNQVIEAAASTPSKEAVNDAILRCQA
ncbi:MAG: RNB domain-containing ribonuclease, partial [Proteobacteria bacterium]|nr:RNB domain-containing ribonuclease [Pseudomonadota bacterium]